MLGVDFRATASWNHLFAEKHITNLFAGMEVNDLKRMQNYFQGWGRVSYNLEKFFPTEKDAESTMKGFKVTINSREHGEGRVIVLDLEHPVGVPEAAKDVHSTSSIR